MLYLINSLDEIPVGTNYRILESCCTYWDNKILVQTLEAVDGLQVSPDFFPGTEEIKVPTDPDYDPNFPCIIPWQTRGVTDNG